jgi:hypothetical protein
MAITTPIHDAGLRPQATNDGQLHIFGDTSAMEKGELAELYDYIKTNKQLIIKALAQSGRPGECESCPASANWEHGQYAGKGLICFYQAYYRGRPGKPKHSCEVRGTCPRQ